MATAKREPRLSDKDVAEVLALTKDSDSVELKLTIPETEHSSTVAALKIVRQKTEGTDVPFLQAREKYFHL